MKKYRITSLSLIVIILTNIVLFSSSLVLAKPVGMNAAINESNRIAKAVEIKNAFMTCFQLSDIKTHVDEVSGVSEYTNPGLIASMNNNLFSGKTSVSTTLDIERSINYSDRNGKIFCSEEGTSESGEKMNLTKLFMQTFNIGSIEKLFCKPDGTSGLFFPHYSYEFKEGSCGEMLKSKNPEFIKYYNPEASAADVDGRSYINQIYEDWAKRQKSGLAPEIDQSKKGNESQTVKYAAAYKAFRMGCMKSGHEEDFVEKRPNEDPAKYYEFTIKRINDDGALTNVYAYLREDDPEKPGYSPSGANSSNYYQAGNNLTCRKLADIINNTADDYLKSIKVAKDNTLNTPCNNKEYKARAQEIVNAYINNQESEKRDSSYIKGLVPLTSPKSESKMQVSKEEFDTLLKAIKEDNFYIDDGNGGKKCLETQNLKPCNTAEMKDKARKIREYYEDRIYNKAETLSAEEDNEYKALSKAIDNDDFTTTDFNGSKKCLETANFNTDVNLEDDVEGEDSQISEETTAEKQSYCQENGGFLSWMLCPAIADGAATASGLLGSITALTNVHTSIIEQFSKQDSSIYKAWSAFRNIANIGFVIMLLVVVFSQVTNIGISNYNIKKILPKLIITAILVNFSYLIMGVLIDLSQIVGNGIGVLIRSVAADGMDSDASARASSTISAIALLVTSAAGGVGIAAAVVTGPALILPVVMFIVTSLISVFFGFIMLTIRQAAIIMVVVLAPLAMVLYALPNTAVLTKKYISTVKALLMLYPIFLFATSAGALASSIIVGTSQDVLMLIVGGLLNVLPYFAIPSLTSKSLAGLGAITAGFDKMRAGALKGVGMAGGAIAASEFYKNLKSDYRADQDVNRAANRLRRYRNIEERGGTLSAAQKRRQSESANILMKDAKMRAGGRSAAGIALSNYEGAGFAGLQAAAQNELMEAEDKNNMMLFDSKGYTPDDMIGKLKDASAADYTKMTDTEKNANDSLIRSLTKSLMSTKAGQKAFESQIASNKDMRLSNRAFGQIAHAALKTPGLADKYQVMNNQFSSYVDGGGDTSDTKVQAGLMGSTFSNGISKTLADMNSDKLQKITKFEVGEMYKSGADTTNLDNAFNMLAAASLKDPNLIADFDGIKQEKVLAAQGKYIDEAQKSTINLRSGGSATVYNPPADFGKYTQTKDASGQIFYTNDRGDIFNASTGKQIKGM